MGDGAGDSMGCSPQPVAEWKATGCCRPLAGSSRRRAQRLLAQSGHANGFPAPGRYGLTQNIVALEANGAFDQI